MSRVILESKRQDWRTPRDLHEAIKRRWRIAEYDLDAAASAENALASKFYSEADDGLSKPWNGLVWCNPPYGRAVGKWVKKALEESKRDECLLVHMLINARPDTSWWHDYVTQASEIIFLRGRVKFLHGLTGKPVAGSTAPSAVIAFGEEWARTLNHPVIQHWDWRSER